VSQTPRQLRYALDSDCFNESGEPEKKGRFLSSADVDWLEHMMEQRLDCLPPEFQILIPHRCRAELDKAGPNVQRLVSSFLYTIEVGLNVDELVDRLRVEKEYQGNAAPGKHSSDANALHDASRYHIDVFVSNDNRIHKRAGDIVGVCVWTPREFMNALRSNTFGTKTQSSA